MAVRISCEKEQSMSCEKLPEELFRILPYELYGEIMRKLPPHPIEEIRIRLGRVASLSTSKGNMPLEYVCTRDSMDAFVSRVCDNSLYAHRETISKGYVTLFGGIRIGICGRAATEGESILGVYDISSVNIRIPHALKNRSVGEVVCRLLRQMKDSRGVLVYSPPGVGKTTLLRSVASRMASGENALRVALIDTRGELSFSVSGEGMLVDVLEGYPRGVGIEIAARTMSAQLMVCDEIGDPFEAEAIISVQNCGVPLVASAHADSISGLLRRTGIARLHSASVFAYYVGIKRQGTELFYTVSSWEDADDIIKNGRGIDSFALFT